MSTTNLQAFSGDVEVAGSLNITGAVTSTVGVDKVSLTEDGTNASRRIIFTTGSTGAQPLKTDAGLTYNPSTNQLTVDGNVGIGVTDPDSKLEVRGNIRASFSDTNHGMFIDAGGTILRDYGGDGAGLHFTANQIFPTNYLGAYSAGGIDLGSSTYRWNNVYTEALNASGTVTATTFSGALSGNATSATNADTVDGLHASSFLRSDADDTVDADVTYTWTATDTHGIAFKNSSYNTFLYLGGWSTTNSDNISRIRTSSGNLHIDSAANGSCFLNWYSAGTIELGTNTNVRGTVSASTFSATSQIYLGTSASIRQTSTPAWTGDPGSGVGKIEYHSNRWYVVAGSNSTELLRVRRNESDKFVIDNNGSISLGTVPAARISGTVGTATNQSGGTVSCTSGSFSGQFSASSASSRDKFRVYPASSDCIGMQSGVTYGDLNDWSMPFLLNNEDARGFGGAMTVMV